MIQKTLPNSRDSVSNLLLMLLGAGMIALCAQVTVPFYPVPMTLQTLSILCVGFALGSQRGLGSLLIYLAAGALGLPVFAGGASTLAFVGPTAGFLLGFVAMAWLAGRLRENACGFSPLTVLMLTIGIAAVIYVPGLLWPVIGSVLLVAETPWTTTSLQTLWVYWVSPFILGDITKATLAAMLLLAGQRLTKK